MNRNDFYFYKTEQFGRLAVPRALADEYRRPVDMAPRATDVQALILTPHWGDYGDFPTAQFLQKILPRLAWVSVPAEVLLHRVRFCRTAQLDSTLRLADADAATLTAPGRPLGFDLLQGRHYPLGGYVWLPWRLDWMTYDVAVMTSITRDFQQLSSGWYSADVLLGDLATNVMAAGDIPVLHEVHEFSYRYYCRLLFQLVFGDRSPRSESAGAEWGRRSRGQAPPNVVQLASTQPVHTPQPIAKPPRRLLL